MSTLTTMLLADAVIKGGPGSGPQGGKKSGAKAEHVHSSSQHASAAQYHARMVK